MHYHYFTLEQRHALEQAIRTRFAGPGMQQELERLRLHLVERRVGAQRSEQVGHAAEHT